ncbi:MAG: PAS domain-containing protein [Bacillus sp. (in: Bacteria)]|nr:PAS domain-containing protein [Bacillus sp. (in: firmicutes)]
MNELLNGEMPLLKEVFNCISDLVFVMEVLPDETFAYAYVNEAAKKRLGMKDDIIGKTMEEILVPERVNLLNKNYRLVVETKKEHTF